MDSPSPEEAARRAAVMRHHEPVGGEDPWVGPPPPAVPIRVVAYDAGWPAQFHEVAAGIRAALGPRALGLEHVGSTWVPADREGYRDAKLAAAAASAEQSVTEYNRRKEPVIRAIYGRMFRAAGWFDDPQTTPSR
ncbi:GrpB family protein [Sinomonas atrocyanea]